MLLVVLSLYTVLYTLLQLSFDTEAQVLNTITLLQKCKIIVFKIRLNMNNNLPLFTIRAGLWWESGGWGEIWPIQETGRRSRLQVNIGLRLNNTQTMIKSLKQVGPSFSWRNTRTFWVCNFSMEILCVYTIQYKYSTRYPAWFFKVITWSSLSFGMGLNSSTG